MSFLRPSITLFATIYHLSIGFLLIFYPLSVNAGIPHAVVYSFIGQGSTLWTGCLMLGASGLAVISMRRGRLDLPGVALLYVQQALLIVAGWGALVVMVEASSPSVGAVPREIVIASQLPILLIAIMHSLIMIDQTRRQGVPVWRP